MNDKNCTFEIRKVSVEKKLRSINNDKSSGSDNLDGKWLRIIADAIAPPICHIFNVSLLESVFPQAWREAKVIPLPKNSKAYFNGSSSRPISLLPTISKLLGKIVFDQIQVKSNQIVFVTYSEMLTYKPLTNIAVLRKIPKKRIKKSNK